MLTQIHAEYTFEELQSELARVRDGGMPKSTLYNWIKRLKILPNESGYYTQDDLDILKDLNRFLKRCPSIAKFEQIHLSA